MPDEPIRNGGPSWKWMVATLMSIVGVLVIGWVTVVWNEIAEMNEKLTKTNDALMVVAEELKEANEQIAIQNAQMAKVWDKIATDHETLMADHWKLDKDDNLLNNWVHPDRGQK